MAGDAWDQKLAKLFVRPLARLPVHPNHLTGLSLLLGLTAAALFAQGFPFWPHVAAGVFMFATFLDHTDGELARLTGKTSEFGRRFDSVVNCTNHAMLFLGIGIGLSQGPMGDTALAVGVLAALCNPFILILRIFIENRRGSQAIAHPGYAGFEIEDFIYLIGPITWLGGLEFFLLAYGLGTVGYLGWTAWKALKARR